MKDKKLKDILLYTGIVLIFLIIAYAYVPQVLSGKIVNQSDISGFVGMSHEMTEWNKAHPDDPAYWTDSMFGGMPTTVISAPRKGDWTQYVYDALLTGKRPATYLFISLLGAFLLMLSLGTDKLVAMGGAIAVTFCSYNLQIIQVGHNTKMQAIAFLPWALAAFIQTYNSALKDKKKGSWLPATLLGAVFFAFAVSFQVKANHQQITYYLALMLLIYAIVLLVRVLLGKEGERWLGRFMAASALLIVFGLAGIATNANKLIPVYKYTAQSMRGGSELASAAGKASGGLGLDYATAWSYGWEELPNLMIPDFNGGSSSGAVSPRHSETYKLLKEYGYPNLNEVSKALPLYWGPQPFTAGPMYMGAITIFLFLLGLLLCDDRDRWWVLVCTVLAIFLGLGSNFMWFTKLFYDHMPFYNKFRTVSMALVMLQTLLPLLAFLALDKILKGGVDARTLKKRGLIAYCVTAGFCLLALVFPWIAGPFTGAVDEGQSEMLVDALQSDRIRLLRMDALRSLLLISAAAALLYWALTVPKSASRSFDKSTREGADAAFARRNTAVSIVCILVFFDLFFVGKRYLGADDFVSPRTFNSQFNKTAVDEMILEDGDLSYRILDLTVSPFNSSRRSYWHKNVGGYSPAKLQRYQELIDTYLNGEINDIYSAAGNVQTVSELQDRLPVLPLLSALNTKYIILGDDIMPAVNPGAMGNAWFVSGTVDAASPDEALALTGNVDLASTAVLEPADRKVLGAFIPSETVEDEAISMTYYSPNELRFRYTAGADRLAVFSEIYYPDGWKARLDGEDVEIPVLRADWILRAAVLPAGDHELVMRFEPDYISRSVSISRASSIGLIIIMLLAVAGNAAVAMRKEEEDGSQG